VPVIDLHAHVTPDRFKAAIQSRGEWYGLRSHVGELQFPGFRLGVEDRLAQMKALGVDGQALSPNVGFFQYDRDLKTTQAIARECNDDIADMVAQHPDVFVGIGTLPLQDVPAAIVELDRLMQQLNFKGVIIGDHVNGHTYDEPQFRPFFEAAESLGALLFFHQSGGTVVKSRIERFFLGNSVGNLTERTLTFGALVLGGVVDRYPGLKLLLAHAGGYTAFGASRMDKAAGVLEEGADATRGFVPPLDHEGSSAPMHRAPSSYLSSFYYDCCTFSGATLRFLIDQVGIDKVVLGSDYPAPMVLGDAAHWVRGLDCLTETEMNAILADNPARLIGWSPAPGQA